MGTWETILRYPTAVEQDNLAKGSRTEVAVIPLQQEKHRQGRSSSAQLTPHLSDEETKLTVATLQKDPRPARPGEQPAGKPCLI